MSKMLILSLLIIQLGVLNAQSETEDSELLQWLKTIPGVEIEEIKPPDLFKESYKIFIRQPIDHFNPDGGWFKQKIFISHLDKKRPVVFVTEGYWGSNSISEPARILLANQILVEHRFFGESAPDSINWNYMTVKQAASDHHRIVELFKQFYHGEWINTGVSKGGQTTIYHRYFYPEDVDVSIPYVAPLNFSDADKRVHAFIENISSPECRAKVYEYQRTLLERRDEILPLFKKFAEENSMTFRIGIDAAFEYCVLEYSFAYWQYGNGDCSQIPERNSPPERLFTHLTENSPPDYFSDQGIKFFEPFFYQAFTETGFYDYDISPFEDLIKFTDGSNKVWYPENATLTFNSELMNDINRWIQTEAENFIFIYGENDPWSATSVCLSGRTNSIKMVLKNGNHGANIMKFPVREREYILKKLDEWLDSEFSFPE
ncbi:MAG: S28 family serine protease [Ignavibacteriaceae bacterium]